MLVSVVICTYNRAEGLRATLECLRQQRFQDFEVVVVNGPSTDHTADVCGEYGDEIRLVDNPAANLSISRNLGIRAAGGEIIAFIDDDALPEPAWLEQAVPAFSEPDVAGVGGIVIDHTGMQLQYAYSASNRFGQPQFGDLEPFDSLCVPGAETFPYLQGTNALFRRDALAEIGLFDEVFDFYLDETDVCVRLVDAGYRLRQLNGAPVHHKYLPSERRTERKVVTNWYSIVRNHVYFGYRHALVHGTELDVLRDAQRFGDYVVSDAAYHEEIGAMPAGHAANTTEVAGRAIVDGALLGRERRLCRFPKVTLEPPVHRPFAVHDPDSRMRIAFVSSGYPPDFAGGIGRFIGDVAPALAARGHEVRVFTCATDRGRVDLESGVWVHRLEPAATPGYLADAPYHVDAFASSVVDELRRIATWWEPDLAYGSLWDAELLGVARVLPHIPVISMLATPAAEVAEHEGWNSPDHERHATFEALVRLERELVARSCVVHAISDAIVSTFAELYPGALRRDRVVVAHIGRADTASPNRPVPRMPPMVLFIGRLEPRKGIECFLRAAANVAASVPGVEFIVAGDDSRLGPSGERYPDMWRSIAGVAVDRLHFVGAVSDEELQHLIEESIVVAMPSLYESFGLVVVEAMMNARAVVASAVGGIRELVDHDVTGLLVTVNEPDLLAAAIAELVQDPGRAGKIGAAGRRHFEHHLSIAAATDRIEGLLTSAIESRATGREVLR